MAEDQQGSIEAVPPEEDEISLLDLLIVLAKHKSMILGLTLGAAILALLISFLMSNVYTGVTRILPPQPRESSASVLLTQLGGQVGGPLGGLVGAGGASWLKDPNALYIAMLKSHTVMERIVRRFDLQKVYDKELMVDTLNKLEAQSAISSGKDGVITIAVDDQDPQRAAAIANAYVEELNKLMQTLSLTEASQRRQFFETQMKPAKDKLTDAEVLLDKTPNTSLQYMDALRNLKYQESIYEILSKQFEMAKLDEAKNSPLIQVLDRAITPEKKSKPKRSLIVITATILALFLAVIFAFLKESFLRAKQQPSQSARIKTLRQYL
jgi:tyrosine-protein kinase Etk/Wzc